MKPSSNERTYWPSSLALSCFGSTVTKITWTRLPCSPRSRTDSASVAMVTPGELTLKKGEPVILELTSRDVRMGFNLPGFNLRADMVPDKVTRVRFVPDKTGTFTFVCDIFCGGGHEEMSGKLLVVE